MPFFKNIALASAFSPRFLPLLAEAKRFADLQGSEFSLIHVGGEDNRPRFDEAFESLQIDPGKKIHWAQGETPAAAIVDCVRAHGMDLLIAGALKKHAETRHFVGDVARDLMRIVPSSLLLFTDAPPEPVPFKNIVVITDFSPSSTRAVKCAVELAEKDRSESLHVLRVFTIFSQARATADGAGERPELMETEEEKLSAFVESLGETAVPIQTHCSEGTTGFAASDYVQTVKADLLVLPSKSATDPEPFPAGTDWIFQVIPTNLLIVRA